MSWETVDRDALLDELDQLEAPGVLSTLPPEIFCLALISASAFGSTDPTRRVSMQFIADAMDKTTARLVPGEYPDFKEARRIINIAPPACANCRYRDPGNEKLCTHPEGIDVALEPHYYCQHGKHRKDV